MFIHCAAPSYNKKFYGLGWFKKFLCIDVVYFFNALSKYFKVLTIKWEVYSVNIKCKYYKYNITLHENNFSNHQKIWKKWKVIYCVSKKKKKKKTMRSKIMVFSVFLLNVDAPTFWGTILFASNFCRWFGTAGPDLLLTVGAGFVACLGTMGLALQKRARNEKHCNKQNKCNQQKKILFKFF